MTEDRARETTAHPDRGASSNARGDSIVRPPTGGTARRRLLGFGRHLAGYFAAMVALVGVNMMTMPENPWFVWPMVGYGGVLAIHAAYAMGLFDVFFHRDATPPPGNG
ncbi:MAG: 2TM domain-containing protein [Pseudomonadota bacterium]